MRGEEDVTGNYDLSEVYGSLGVTKATLTVTSDSSSKVYDGTALTDEGYTYTGFLASTDTIVATYTGSQLAVGSSDNVFSVKVMRGEEDVTGNYDLSEVYGSLGVTQATVTGTSDSYSKVD